MPGGADSSLPTKLFWLRFASCFVLTVRSRSQSRHSAAGYTYIPLHCALIPNQSSVELRVWKKTSTGTFNFPTTWCFELSATSQQVRRLRQLLLSYRYFIFFFCHILFVSRFLIILYCVTVEILSDRDPQFGLYFDSQDICRNGSCSPPNNCIISGYLPVFRSDQRPCLSNG